MGTAAAAAAPERVRTGTVRRQIDRNGAGGRGRVAVLSSDCTVIVFETVPAVNDGDVPVKLRMVPGAAVTVSCCVAEARPAAAAVIVGAPALVSS